MQVPEKKYRDEVQPPYQPYKLPTWKLEKPVYACARPVYNQ